MFCKFSFVLAILAFFMLSATALPLAADGAGPNSLMGRTFARRAAEANQATEIVEARSDIALDTPVEVAARAEALSYGERLYRRALNRRSTAGTPIMARAAVAAHPAIARRAPEPKPEPPLNIMRIVAARSNSRSLH